MVSHPGHGIKSLSLPPSWGWGHGLVLKKRILGEEDLTLEVFFFRRGILEGVVRRGALPTTPLSGALEPPAITFFHFQWLTQERVRLRQWEERRLFPGARNHPRLILEICHTLSSLVPRGWWEPGLLKRALKALRALEGGKDPREVELLFRLGILEATGHSPWHLLPRHWTRNDLEAVIKDIWPQILHRRWGGIHEDTG